VAPFHPLRDDARAFTARAGAALAVFVTIAAVHLAGGGDQPLATAEANKGDAGAGVAAVAGQTSSPTEAPAAEPVLGETPPEAPPAETPPAETPPATAPPAEAPPVEAAPAEAQPAAKPPAGGEAPAVSKSGAGGPPPAESRATGGGDDEGDAGNKSSIPDKDDGDGGGGGKDGDDDDGWNGGGGGRDDDDDDDHDDDDDDEAGGLIGIALRVDVRRPVPTWRLVLLHERRIVYQGVRRSTRAGHALRYRRYVPDWDGRQTVAARLSPRAGRTCRMEATI
jgi:hypothetical protein